MDNPFFVLFNRGYYCPGPTLLLLPLYPLHGTRGEPRRGEAHGNTSLEWLLFCFAPPADGILALVSAGRTLCSLFDSGFGGIITLPGLAFG